MVVYKGRVSSSKSAVILSNGHEAELAIVRHRPSVVLIPVGRRADRDDSSYRHALRAREFGSCPPGMSKKASQPRLRQRVSAKKRSVALAKVERSAASIQRRAIATKK